MGRICTGCGVGMDALGSPICAHAMAPPLRMISGLAPKKAGLQAGSEYRVGSRARQGASLPYMGRDGSTVRGGRAPGWQRALPQHEVGGDVGGDVGEDIGEICAHFHSTRSASLPGSTVPTACAIPCASAGLTWSGLGLGLGLG